MNNHRDVMRQALDALEQYSVQIGIPPAEWDDAITVLRAALDEQETCFDAGDMADAQAKAFREGWAKGDSAL